MIHNANESNLPLENFPISEIVPPETMSNDSLSGIKFDLASIVANPDNIHWMQGAPLIFLNNEAPKTSRCLDALACVFRSCCDKAIERYCELLSPADSEQESSFQQQPSRTASAVLANEDQLCSRNIVLSVDALLRRSPNRGQETILLCLKAFFENHDGFTAEQIKGLLHVGNMFVENPLMLYHPGPTYHMASNAAVLLAHICNYLAAGAVVDKASVLACGEDETEDESVRDVVLDTYTALRHVLTLHRRKLPLALHCHGLPRPSKDGTVDVGETLLCGCRACQGFVLGACSPCVAAERAATAQRRRQELMELQADDIEPLPPWDLESIDDFLLEGDVFIDL